MLTTLFVVQPFISLIVFTITGSAAVFIYKVVRNQIDKAAIAARDYRLAINRETTMAIHGIKDVKISLKENLFVSKFLNKAEPLSRIVGVQEFYSQCPTLILETIGFAMICLSVFTMLLWSNTSTAYVSGTMAILAVTAWKALPAVNQILGSITQVRNSLPYISNQIKYFDLIEINNKTNNRAYNRAYNRVDDKTDDKNDNGADNGVDFESDKKFVKNKFSEFSNSKSMGHYCEFCFTKNIKFNDVSFCYDDNGKKVLSNLFFEINKGETTGVIGPSGAGKSTLVDLLIGLLKPSQGIISIDDIPLTGKSLKGNMLPNWLKITGYVPQSPYIYDGTLAENIAFGMDPENINRKQVRKCCTMASMDDFIHDLPNNIDSFIGERGVKLSGGQQQRVAIARALYSNPEVMIFDEATSSLDTASEKAIIKTIYSFKGRQTLIIIAHRLTTVENCDKLIWLEKGRINMIGSPKKILSLYKQRKVQAK